MTTQFITNDKGEKTAVIIPISEYEDLLHKNHLNLELSHEYETTIDQMLIEEDNGIAQYISFETIKAKFLKG